MCLDPDWLFEQDVQGTDIVMVDIDVNVDELENKVGEGYLTQSNTAGLITTQDHTVDLVYLVGFKIKYRQGIVSYYLRVLELFIIVKFSFKLNFLEEV